MRPLASLLALVTTVATPAVLAACLTLCAPGMRHAMPAPAPAPAAEAAGCPDHAVSAPDAPLVRLSAADVACCDDVLEASAPSVTAERADTHLRLAGLLAPRATWAIAPSLVRPVRLGHDRGSPPPPLRRPSVLRI